MVGRYTVPNEKNKICKPKKGLMEIKFAEGEKKSEMAIKSLELSAKGK